MSNITNVTGLNASLSYHAGNQVSIQGQSQMIDPANNLGYGIGRIVRSAFDHLWHAWQKMWAVEPTSEEFALRRHDMIFRNGLRECVQRLGAALDDVRKNPHDPSKLEKIKSVAAHYALYLTSQEKPELRAFQHKALQPLEEKISKLAHPHMKNALKQLLPVFQEANAEQSPTAKTKRVAQQVGTFPASFDLTTLMGPNGFIVNGLAAGDRLGWSVSAAGDLNGDGIADFVLGAQWASPGGRANAGAAYVLFGQAGGWPGVFNLTALNGTNGFIVNGLVTGAVLGYSVSTAGDLNGDGKADLVLGAPFASPGGRTGAGTAYVLFGQASGWPALVNLTTWNGINGFIVDGLAASDELGISVSTAGDINSDGTADLVLGACYASPGGRFQAGTVYVLFGQASGWPRVFNLTTLNGANGFKVEGLAAGDYLGISVSTAGDVNGDGKADLVLGAFGASPGGRTNAGTAYVVFGQASGWPGAFNLTTLNGTNRFKVEGLAAGDQLGYSVSTAGDLDGDGKIDLVLGAPIASPGGLTQAGTAYVLFGRASGWPGAFNLTTLNGTNGFKVEGLAAGNYLGNSVSTAGDFNGDGKADLVLGAPVASPGGLTQGGTAYVLFGRTSGWPGAFNLTTLNGTNGFTVNGLVASDWLGVSVSTAGDVNGDGISDLLLGAPGNNTAVSRSAAYIILGRNIFSTINLNPVTIEVKIPQNLNGTFVPLTADILSISNNTVMISLVDGQGYAVVFTGNCSAVPVAAPFSPLEVIGGFSIARGNATSSAVPVFKGCNVVGQCSFSNATTPLQQTVAIEGVDWKLIVPIVVGVAAVTVGGGLIFYFTYYRKLKRGQIEEERNPYHKLETRMKK